MLVVAYIRVAVWLITSNRQTFQIRLALLQAVLRQEIGWFDTNDAGELGSRLSESVQAYAVGRFRNLCIYMQLCNCTDLMDNSVVAYYFWVTL